MIKRTSRKFEAEATKKTKQKAAMPEKKAAWIPAPPPPPPPVAPRMARGTGVKNPVRPTIKSVTRDEIDKFWRRKKMEEEEHLLAAQKAAARIRSRALTEEDYKRFEESLKEIIISSDEEEKRKKEREEGGGDSNKEVRVGIKDWWTKSKYAYLNQPAMKYMEKSATPKRATSSYIPQKINLYCSSSTPIHPITSFSLGVF